MFSMLPKEQKLPHAMMQRISDHVGSTIARMTQHRKPSSSIVYHYTNGFGLQGIAESKSLWATHIGFMNDTQEFREAIRLISHLAGKRIQSANLSELAKRVMIELASATNSVTADDIHPWFVCCFSECKDDLAQWRSYGGTQSKFALGFENQHLSALTSALHEKSDSPFVAHLAPVVYSVSELEAVCNRMLDFIVEQYPLDAGEASPDNPELFILDWLRAYASLASAIAPIAKNRAFEQEREWRIIVMPFSSQMVRYRNRGALLTPYLAINLTSTPFRSGGAFWVNPLRECWVGPSPHMEANRFAARNLLGANDFLSVKMHYSSAPYRDL